MNDELIIMRLVQGERLEVFNYFVDRELLEEWAYPDGMQVRVPLFEAKPGGKYRFLHSGKDGTYESAGYVKDFQPGSKLVQVDQVCGPDGEVIYPKLETVTTFSEKPGGTFITITQRGFPDEASRSECETGWNQSLDRLTAIFASRAEPGEHAVW
jgi:uncharacterized protein YndB with AHSA1/START domain